MSKIHSKTGSVCIICDNPYKRGIIFHKTRRQTHGLCLDCGVGYLKPIISKSFNNIKKNIRKNVEKIKCPGSYHSASRNHCKYMCTIYDLEIPDCDISVDMFNLTYILSSPYVYMCPDEKCSQLFDIDQDFIGNMLICHGGCQVTWCRTCLVQPFHVGMTCIEHEVENQNTENGKFIWKMRGSGKLKFCPQCKVPTFKNNGCNKMVCIVCHVKWCWLCTSIDIEYDHYNSEYVGECTGKLWEGVDESGNAIQ